MMAATEHIANFFRSRRLQSGRTVADCANLLNVSPQTIELYELGLDEMPLIDMISLVNFLSLPPEELIELSHDVALEAELAELLSETWANL